MPGDTLFTVPNAISFSRFGFAIAFPFVHDARVRVALIVAAGASDFLDGYIARRQRTTSRIGALVDPFADRLFVLVAVSTYLFEALITTTQYFIFISRDLMTAIGFVVARFTPSLRRVTFRARFAGKVVTVLQLAVLLAVLLAPNLTAGLIAAIGVTAAWAVLDYTLVLHRSRVHGPRPG